jgi:hypothetical protein
VGKMAKIYLCVTFDKDTGVMSCKCDATLNDLILTTGFLLRQQLIMLAKEQAPKDGIVLDEKMGKYFLAESAKRYSKQIANIIEFGEVK